MKMKGIISMFVRLIVLCFCLLIVGNNDRCAALESSYEKEFDGGFVTVEVVFIDVVNVVEVVVELLPGSITK